MGDMIIFDNNSAKVETSRIEEQRGSPGKMRTSDIGRIKKYADPSEDITKPWTRSEKDFQRHVQNQTFKGFKTMPPIGGAEDIDESVFSMDEPGDKNYLYWPYIPDASFEVMTEEINKELGRDKKKLFKEHVGEVKANRKSAFDTWLNNGL